jgi:hypothetical protein
MPPRDLVVRTRRHVFISAESSEQQTRWLNLADTALHNPKPLEQKVQPGSKAQQDHQQVSRDVRGVVKKIA